MHVDATLLRALHQMELRWARAEEVTLVGLWQWDADHGRVSWSPELYTIFGLDDTAVVPSLASVRLRVHPDDRQMCERFMSEALHLGGSVTTLRIVRPDRSVRLLEIRGRRLDTDPGSPMKIIGTARDRTDAVAAARRLHELTSALCYEMEHEVHDEAQPALATQPSSLVRALEEALRNDEFHLVYQPKISLTTNRIIGVEALLRWDRPGVGSVAPAEFIPAAEASGQVRPIGEWVLREACQQAAVWQQAYAAFPLTISINVSARQFGPGLCEAVRSAAADSGVDLATICLELTETTVMDDVDASLEVLNELKALGVKVSLDDFGTGHSSLEYLHRMPIDELKIDRSFVEGLGANPVSGAIVASVISLAHAMGCDVVAEGIETHEQLERVRMLGCDKAQGFLIARPLPPAQVDEHLAADAAGERWPRGAGESRGRTSTTQSVLVVDDAADVRMLVTMSLTAAGFTTHEAGTARAAVALARRLRPDCVLLDITMPDSSGIDVCRVLRSDPATAGCTIVMLTQRGEGASKAEAFLFGADDYIVKPFAPRELVTRVHAALRRRREMTPSHSEPDPALIEMVRTARAEQAAGARVPALSERFSERQLEIIRRLLRGERVPNIASQLFLSQSTVRNHLSTIYRKLGVGSQEELVLLLRDTTDW